MPHNQLVKKKLVNCWHSMDHRFAQNSNTIEEILFTDLNFHDSSYFRILHYSELPGRSVNVLLTTKIADIYWACSMYLVTF